MKAEVHASAFESTKRKDRLMSNQLSDFFKSQQDREHLKNIENLRRKGERFIKVRYEGRTIPQVDSEGICFNIRPHGLRDVEAYQKTDISTGKTDWNARHGARALIFRQSITGEIEADIWDDPDEWNRHFILSHPELIVLDTKLAEEIKKTKDKPFKAELSPKEELERDIAAKLKQLEKLEEKEKSTQTVQIRRGRPKKGDGIDGINESTSDVDSPGMSRMESGGKPKRDPTAVQSSTPAS